VPNANANGSDSFTFKVSDGSLDSNVATISVTIAADNDAPIANNGSLSATEDTTATGTLTSSDVDGPGTTYSIVAQGTKGVVTITNATTGAYSYVPNANANGSDSFTFTVSDGSLDSNVATISVTINAVNDAPTANPQSVSTNEDTASAITLTGNDVDGDALVTFTVISGPANGTLSGTGANRTYTPNANYHGSDSFTFKVNDGTVDSAPATVSLTVASVNDVPVFTKGANKTVAHNAGAQTVVGWATGISAGPADESSQALNFIVSNNNNPLFSVQPAVAANGTLTYTPASGANGVATVTVSLHDNGGVANGGVDTSAPQTFTITVTGPPSLAIADSSVVEGNSGTRAMVFTVTLSAAAAQTVTVSWNTLNGTAITPGDYIAASGSLSFTAGQLSKTVSVQVRGETINENNETFSVRLTNPVNAPIADNTGIGTIINDDTPPQMMMSSTSVTEGDSGQKMMTFGVTPTNGNHLPVTVDYTTLAGVAAKEGYDFVPVTGTLVWDAETTDTKFVSVPVLGNTRRQPTRKVLLRLANAIEAILDRTDVEGDILDDDPMPTMTISDVWVGENNSGAVDAVLNVTLSNESDEVVTVNFSTADAAAIGGTDYEAQTGTLTFVPGQTSHVITIPVKAAATGEGYESFNVDLTGVANAIVVKDRAVVTIVPPGSWLSTTTAAFEKGTMSSGAYLADTAGGEVTLAPTVGVEFAGTELPAGWITTVHNTGGTATVANGALAVNGVTVVAPLTYTSGRTLEFVATFNGQPNQNVGFGLTGALLPPYAMFGVKPDGLFYARSLAPAQLRETVIPGNWFNAPHRFRIDWNPTTVDFYIDGILRVTHAITFGKAALRPAVSDQSSTGGAGGILVDWMRMTAYSASGVYTSPVKDFGGPVTLESASWLADLPSSTGVVVEVRTGSTASPDASWTGWTTLASSGSKIGGAMAQFAQYRLTLSTSVPNAAPAVKEVVVTIQR
jgi:hypothetical protein